MQDSLIGLVATSLGSAALEEYSMQIAVMQQEGVEAATCHLVQEKLWTLSLMVMSLTTVREEAIAMEVRLRSA